MKKKSKTESKDRNWLLLRGLTRGCGHWADFPDKLNERFPKDRILLLDLPGNGKAHQQQSPWQLRSYVEFLRESLKDLSVSGELRIVAVSLGAMVSLEWMKIHPKEITKGFFINTSLKGSGRIYDRLRPENYLALLKVLKMKDVKQREELILRMTSRNLAAQEKHLGPFAEFSSRYPVQAQNFLRQLVAASQATITEKKPGDLELLVSVHDNFINSRCSFNIARRWGIEPRIHPWAGHDISLDDPDWVVGQLD